MVAGLQATGRLPEPAGLSQRAKVLRVKHPRGSDVGLIDAVLLRNDHVGNLLPFDAERIAQILLTRAEPNSIGMSPIGGLLHPVFAEDDYGLLVGIDKSKPPIPAPVSPGLFRDVHVGDLTEIAFNVAVPFQGPGVIALDGDRDIKLREEEVGHVTVQRDGPWVIDIEAAMRWIVVAGIMAPQ